MVALDKRIKSVAVVGAGAAGAITAAALIAEEYYDRVVVYERRPTPGGTWIYDGDPHPLPLSPGKLPPDTDPPLSIPSDLPKTTSPNLQERFHKTPIYDTLTTNVPSVAMSFSDISFAYGPFVPHHIPRQYIENYFSVHKLDNPTNLFLNTTVEDLSYLPHSSDSKDTKRGGWKLTLRKQDVHRKVDVWWEEEFDAVVLANGHYAVPFIPEVEGLPAYLKMFPNRVQHSKTYRHPSLYANKRVLVIGNSASGHDTTLDLLSSAHLPVYQSRRSPSPLDGDTPPDGLAWKPKIAEFLPSGRIVFEDSTHLDNIDVVIYATGYLPSYPFWNARNNGREFWDYEKSKLRKSFQHTFLQDFKNLAIVGVPWTLTFRSFEYQAIAIARLWAGRSAKSLPSVEEQERWEREREEKTVQKGSKFHDIIWAGGETAGYLGYLYSIAGLGELLGKGRNPPRLSEEIRWALEHLRKYSEPDRPDDDEEELKVEAGEVEGNDWVVVERPKRVKKDLLHFL